MHTECILLRNIIMYYFMHRHQDIYKKSQQSCRLTTASTHFFSYFYEFEKVADHRRLRVLHYLYDVNVCIRPHLWGWMMVRCWWLGMIYIAQTYNLPESRISGLFHELKMVAAMHWRVCPKQIDEVRCWYSIRDGPHSIARRTDVVVPKTRQSTVRIRSRSRVNNIRVRTSSGFQIF